MRISFPQVYQSIPSASIFCLIAEINLHVKCSSSCQPSSRLPAQLTSPFVTHRPETARDCGSPGGISVVRVAGLSLHFYGNEPDRFFPKQTVCISLKRSVRALVNSARVGGYFASFCEQQEFVPLHPNRPPSLEVWQLWVADMWRRWMQI